MGYPKKCYNKPKGIRKGCYHASHNNTLNIIGVKAV